MKSNRSFHFALRLGSVAYILVFSFGGIALAWTILHWIPASIVTLLAIFFWPAYIIGALRPKEPPVFTWQIDHPGGGIGVVIAMMTFLFPIFDKPFWNIALLISCVLLLAPLFSVLSEFCEYVLQKWMWNSRIDRPFEWPDKDARG